VFALFDEIIEFYKEPFLSFFVECRVGNVFLLPCKMLKQSLIQKYPIRDDEMNGGKTTFTHPTWLILTELINLSESELTEFKN